MEYNQPFNQLFERYIYSTLVMYIDQVDQDTQTQLVRQFSSLHDRLYPEINFSATRKQFVSQKDEHWRDRVQLIRRLLASYQRRIKTISVHIDMIDALIEREQQNLSPTANRTAILNHYQAVRTRFEASREKVQRWCQNELFKMVTD